MSTPRRVTSIACLLIGLSACQTMGLFEPDPTVCEPGAFENRPCGTCDLGVQSSRCDDTGAWQALEPCQEDPYDIDGDGRSSLACVQSGRTCCGELDCDDNDRLRWVGNADLDGDGHEWAGCCDEFDRCGDDCNDDDPLRWTGNADLDEDGRDDASCCDAFGICGDDCNDDDPLRWTGNADLDEDGYEDERCCDREGHCGNDCNDDDPLRWTGNADLDGDGVDHSECGGSDCNDEDPYRMVEGADLDGDGYGEPRCGGDDCDDQCLTCYPGAVRQCGTARDHDCDGIVDELTGCGICHPVAVEHRLSLGGTGPAQGLFVVPEPTTATFSQSFTAYVAAESGMHRFDIECDESCTVVDDGFVDTGSSSDVFVVGFVSPWRESFSDDAFLQHFVLVTATDGLYVISSIDASRSSIVDGPMATGDSSAVFAVGDYAFVVGFSGISKIDIWSPWQSWIVHPFPPVGEPMDIRDVFVTDGTLFMVANPPYFAGARGLYALDIETAEYHEPWQQPTRFDRPEALFVVDEVALVAAAEGLCLVDVSNVDELSFISCFDIGAARGVFALGDLAYVTTDAGITVVDISTPASPSQVLEHFGPHSSRDLFVSGEHLFVTTDDGLELFRLVCR